MIKIQSLQYSYNKELNLSFRDWTVTQGEQWLMLGESGSGKTTLLHLLTGLLKPSHGEVYINQTAICQLSNTKMDHFRGAHIGLIFQRAHLIKSLTVLQNLLLAQSLAGLPVNNKRVEDVLNSLNIADKKANYPSQLSQGQLQRVSIARAVVNKPSLLIADEPTSSLDDRNARAVLDLLITQAEQNNATLLIATHDKRVQERIERAYILQS
ncbi:ABC transporter ATP-binding protein [Mucilaginibacter gilvus]|uniref:ATP-binding cassette domain-containing protein n=1 Tax=Mucilaginibacter gilvus TaxID=2305909 RepID=A0A3S3V7V5_9SPHI|nr:ATP-binding cassette domain-containing protein [Mucilaginibacter gilvus]RWY47457.1 ATP-binding cassette domain-containing protein [Mucilaginibacter gilvus]